MRFSRLQFRFCPVAIAVAACLALLVGGGVAVAAEAEGPGLARAEARLAHPALQAPARAIQAMPAVALIPANQTQSAVYEAVVVDGAALRPSVPSSFRLRNEALLQYAAPLRVGESDLHCSVRVPGRSRSLVSFEVRF